MIKFIFWDFWKLSISYMGHQPWYKTIFQELRGPFWKCLSIMYSDFRRAA